jgi:hypothetical protein
MGKVASEVVQLVSRTAINEPYLLLAFVIKKIGQEKS